LKLKIANSCVDVNSGCDGCKLRSMVTNDIVSSLAEALHKRPHYFGSGAIIGAGSGVVSDVPAGKVLGYPSRSTDALNGPY
jgi:serine acetyltransferase